MSDYSWSSMRPPSSVRKKRAAPAQDALLEYIKDYKTANDGLLPTYEEMASALGVNVSAVYNAALRLVGHGVLRFNANRKLIIGGKWIPPED